MIYREYGRTGKKVSVIGFGGMRFEDIDNEQQCVEMLVHAAERGINYFDTAPAYFGVKGETRFGAGLRQLRRCGLPYYVASKTFESTESGIRREIEQQLKRMDVETIDFYHAWCITDLQSWRERKANGLLDAFRRLRDQKLIGHICVSSHLIGDDIRELLDERVFEGVLFGYSAYNFQAREAAFAAIRRHKIGCAVMNPLGGGLIPQNPDLFAFLVGGELGDEGPVRSRAVVQAALRFLVAHQDISVILVGFENRRQIDDAVDAIRGDRLHDSTVIQRVRQSAAASFSGICTGCRYCLGSCPEDIPIPQLMDAYNQLILRGEKDLINRLKYHWDLPMREAARCIECGRCEESCTQHLQIIERLAAIAEIGDRHAHTTEK
ncbi:MAG: aldo/keto reductase [Spirochaetaceae bacterium]|nr:MAG: aldo/keto reductase [Spirochaetaceae bacterium]